jgi:hypothetical protein
MPTRGPNSSNGKGIVAGTAQSRVISKVARGPEKAFRILGALEMVYCGLLGAFIGYKEGRAKSYQEDPAMPYQ